MKKFASLILALSMVATLLVGCGSASTGSSADSTTIKIGGIGPTTGGAAVYGIAVQNGAKLAVEEINAAGGINGVEINFNFADDEHDAEKAVNAYNTLKDWGMQVLMGTVTSNPCIAVSEETKNDNMFQITPSGTAVKCVQYDNAFRVCFSDPNQGTKSAQYIGENKIATKIAIIYDNSDVYSSGIYENFKANASQYGLDTTTSIGRLLTRTVSMPPPVQIRESRCSVSSGMVRFRSNLRRMDFRTGPLR